MKRTFEIYNKTATLWICIELPEGPITSNTVYQAMNPSQVDYVDRTFGVPTAKKELVRAQRQLKRAENAVTYWHERIDILRSKLERLGTEDGQYLSEKQLRLICDLDQAEAILQRKLHLCGQAYEAVQEAEASYVINIDTFKVVGQTD